MQTALLTRSCTVFAGRRTLLRIRTMSASNSDLLINQSRYSWLKELGLEADNPGVFDGSWHANGQVKKQDCPIANAIFVLFG